MAAKTSAFGKVFRLYQKNVIPHPYSVILEHRQCEEYLLFESNAIAVLTSQEMETVKRQYAKMEDAYGCLGILQLNLGESAIQFLVMVTGCVSIGKISDYEVYRVTQTSFVSLRGQVQDEDYVADIKKLLHSGTFYFSRPLGGGSSFDLTLCAQRKAKTDASDNRFFWNRMLHVYFLRFEIDPSMWLLKIMCGSVEIRTVYARSKQAKALIVSRLSCERVGTRFNVRGCNDDGHVANFVETEQALFLDDKISSYVQVRGSVPLFWEQPGVQVGSHKVKLSRGLEASSHAYDQHFALLKKRYGSRLVVINLLSSSLVGSKESESLLSKDFQTMHNESSHRDVPHIVFDYNFECKNNPKNVSKLKEAMREYADAFGVFCSVGGKVEREQKGTFRTNCLDCLDRTNCAQTLFGLELLRQQLDFLFFGDENWLQFLSRFEEVFRQMWINNGNEVSKIYAGTGAIQGGSKIMDGARSAARTIQNNLLDSSKQEAIDVFLLGNTMNSELADMSRILLAPQTLHASTSILREMCKHYREYTRQVPLKIAVGTYNVNGGKHFRSVAYKDVSLADWLLDPIRIAKTKSLIDASDDDHEIPIDVFAIGFQEIVDLNASNIMAVSSENATQWAEELQKVLSRDRDYVMLTYVQLVGVCLYVFVRRGLADVVRDVAVDSVKTGLGGTTGNKGGVAIRFLIKATSFCFVCAHFAAGQSQVTERNADFAEITKKLAFPMGRTLLSHDYVFWCGDFNYRVDMDKATMKEAIKENALAGVLQCDQLTLQRNEGKVFSDYDEGEITFPPTYKYDLFSDDYDTSEKARSPAWTDRVLWRRRKMYPEEHLSDEWDGGKMLHYGRAELKQSDHRPVIAVLQVKIKEVVMDKREEVFERILNEIGPLDGTVIVRAPEANLEDEAIVAEIIERLSDFGDATLVRFVNQVVLVTFSSGKSALEAVANPEMEVQGKRLHLEMKCPHWIQQTLKEIEICSDNSVPLVDGKEEPAVEIQIPSVPVRPSLPVTQPMNLHTPLQPTVMLLPEAPKLVPSRPAPPVPQRPISSPPSGPRPTLPPPVPQRQAPPSPPEMVPPPIPARQPPIPPRP